MSESRVRPLVHAVGGGHLSSGRLESFQRPYKRPLCAPGGRTDRRRAWRAAAVVVAAAAAAAG